MIWDLSQALFFVLIIVISSGVAVDIFEKLARELRVNRLMVAMIVLGLSTSLPELFIAITAAVRSQPEIALGNIVGANIANLSWIVGGAALVYGTIPVVGEYLRRDLWVTIGMILTSFLLLTDGRLTRVDGAFMVIAYFGYIYFQLHGGNGHLKHMKHLGRKKPVHREHTVLGRIKQMLVLAMALLLLTAGSWSLIDVATKMVSSLGVSLFWVGVVIISIGTTLPELVLSLLASGKRDISLILENILRSVVVNATLILGITSLISPIAQDSNVQRGVSGLFLVMIVGLFWLFTKSKHRLDRWEGAVLVGVYAMFIGVQLIIA